MKKIILTFLIITSFFILENNVFSQTFEIQAIENDMGYLEVQMRETSGTGTPTTTTPIAQISFEIRWPNTSAADVAILCTTNQYTIGDGLLAKQNHAGDGLFWRNFVKTSGTPVYPATNWTQNIWETIAIFKVTGTPASIENFDIAPSGWVPQDLVWTQGSPAVAYFPTPNGAVSNYSFPTIIYDLVWTGTDATYPTYWDVAANWVTECGVTGTIPNTGNNCFVPVVTSGNYPADIGQVTGFGAHQPICDNLQIATGASISIDYADLATGVQVSYTVNNDLLNYGTVTIVPNGQLEVVGNTYIDAAQGLVVQADVTGVGSFLDDKAGSGTTTITYGASGSAQVQTYVSNLVGSGSNFYMHLMGPTVADPTYSGPGTGADLQTFDVAPGNTFAYSWNEPTTAWINQSSYTYPVPTTDGIGISTDDATTYTMVMTGELISGDILSTSLTNGGSHYELISNPYPSAIEFDAFQSSFSNPSVIHPHYWIWDPSQPLGAGNYVPYSSTTTPGSTIQVAQAFFVDVITPGPAGPVTFYNINRTHSNVPFRDVVTDKLTLHISGGGVSFGDRVIIHFYDGGTPNYEGELDVLKWNSMYANATQIRSIAEDGTELSINVMPELNLQGEMVSVPVHFQCGYEGEYTFTASDLETFEYGTEIWLEDKLNANFWHNLSAGNETYTFTATADDPHDRFIVHFFGPTSVGEFEAANVLIYSDNEYALIRNNTKNEIIEEISIYSLTGTKILHKQVPVQNQHRFYVSNHAGYYIVRVVTDKNIYTEKVFVH